MRRMTFHRDPYPSICLESLTSAVKRWRLLTAPTLRPGTSFICYHPLNSTPPHWVICFHGNLYWRLCHLHWTNINTSTLHISGKVRVLYFCLFLWGFLLISCIRLYVQLCQSWGSFLRVEGLFFLTVSCSLQVLSVIACSPGYPLPPDEAATHGGEWGASGWV